MGHSRPIDGGSAVSAFHPFATKSVRTTNAASGHERHFAPQKNGEFFSPITTSGSAFRRGQATCIGNRV